MKYVYIASAISTNTSNSSLPTRVFEDRKVAESLVMEYIKTVEHVVKIVVEDTVDEFRTSYFAYGSMNDLLAVGAIVIAEYVPTVGTEVSNA